MQEKLVLCFFVFLSHSSLMGMLFEGPAPEKINGERVFTITIIDNLFDSKKEYKLDVIKSHTIRKILKAVAKLVTRTSDYPTSRLALICSGYRLAHEKKLSEFSRYRIKGFKNRPFYLVKALGLPSYLI